MLSCVSLREWCAAAESNHARRLEDLNPKSRKCTHSEYPLWNRSSAHPVQRDQRRVRCTPVECVIHGGQKSIKCCHSAEPIRACAVELAAWGYAWSLQENTLRARLPTTHDPDVSPGAAPWDASTSASTSSLFSTRPVVGMPADASAAFNSRTLMDSAAARTASREGMVG